MENVESVEYPKKYTFYFDKRSIWSDDPSEFQVKERDDVIFTVNVDSYKDTPHIIDEGEEVYKKMKPIIWSEEWSKEDSGLNFRLCSPDYVSYCHYYLRLSIEDETRYLIFFAGQDQLNEQPKMSLKYRIPYNECDEFTLSEVLEEIISYRESNRKHGRVVE